MVSDQQLLRSPEVPTSEGIRPYILPHLRGTVVPFTQTPAGALTKLTLNPGAGSLLLPESHISDKGPLGFLDLPGEVRNKIYLYALTSKWNRVHRCIRWGPSEGQTYTFGTSILYANWQIYREASSIFYGENLFVAIRDCSQGIIRVLIEQNIPAVAVSIRATNCARMAMIFQFGDHGINRTSYNGIQIVIPSQDFLTFVWIAYELQLINKMPQGVRYSVKLAEHSNPWSKTPSTELMLPLVLLRSMEMVEAPLWQLLEQRPTSMAAALNVKSFLAVYKSMKARARARFVEGDHTSAAFYFHMVIEHFGRWRPTIHMTLFTEDPAWQDKFRRIYIRCRYWHAQALEKIGRYREAHGSVRFAVNNWPQCFAVGAKVSLISGMCHLRARLDEIHGSLTKLQNAVFWFSEALRHDPGNVSIKDDIKRVEGKIFILDSSNW